MDIQKRLFEEIKKKIDPNHRMVDVVGELLDLGADATYRRLRCDKEISIGELTLLSKHFHISIDALNESKHDAVLFQFLSFDLGELNQYKQYLHQFSNAYQSVLGHEHKEFVISAQDIPLYNFIPFNDLTYFKIYSWHVNMSNRMVYFEDFVELLEQDKILDNYYEIGDAYMQIPSREVWSIHSFDPFLSLLEYYNDISCFRKKETFVSICKQLHLVIDNMEAWARQGEKIFKGKAVKYELYLSPLSLLNDFFLLKNERADLCTIKLFTINSISSDNPKFSNDVEIWIESITSKSTLISATAERERFRFLRHLRKRVDETLNAFMIQ